MRIVLFFVSFNIHFLKLLFLSSEPNAKNAFEWFKGRVVSLTFKFKLMIASYQIVQAIPYTFQIQYPLAFSEFYNSFRVFNFSLSQIIPISCIYTSDYVDTLVVVTLSPILFTFFLVIIAVLEFFIRKQYMVGAHATHVLKVQSLYKELRFRYFSFLLVITFMVLPSITTTIFKIFPCENLDPNNDDEMSHNYYLVADYSINCESDRYRFGVTYAIFMIILYPVGLPALYYWLLYQHRLEISKRGIYKLDDDTWLQSLSKLSEDAKVLQFLYRDYKPQYWYFEIIETFRRLFLTAVLSVIMTGKKYNYALQKLFF
jgi:hypothetical protein